MGKSWSSSECYCMAALDGGLLGSLLASENLHEVDDSLDEVAETTVACLWEDISRSTRPA